MYYTRDPFAFLVFWNATRVAGFFTYRSELQSSSSSRVSLLIDKMGSNCSLSWDLHLALWPLVKSCVVDILLSIKF